VNLHEHTGAVRLTATALSHACAGSWRQTGADVQAVHDRYGGDGIQVLLRGLADAILVPQGGPGMPGELVMSEQVGISQMHVSRVLRQTLTFLRDRVHSGE
jgi:hypothetical protein